MQLGIARSGQKATEALKRDREGRSFSRRIVGPDAGNAAKRRKASPALPRSAAITKRLARLAEQKREILLYYVKAVPPRKALNHIFGPDLLQEICVTRVEAKIIKIGLGFQ